MTTIVVKSPIRFIDKSRMSTHDTFSMVDAASVQTTEPEMESPYERSLRNGSLPEVDQEILALIHSVPQKVESITSIQNFYLYEKALKVYQAVSTKKLPRIYIPDRAARRKVYQLVFDALYRKFTMNRNIHALNS